MKIFVGVLVFMLLASAPGWAVLGEYENSVTADQQRLHAQLQQTIRQGYSIKQLSAAGGRTVREYVSSAGLVFGVAWQGPTMPNLQQLTGSYFVQVKHAAQSRRRRGGPFIIQAKDFVLVSGGHMRSFHGMAYVPSLLPAGVSAEVIR
jgi:Protein of unknown function (DUF2844)